MIGSRTDVTAQVEAQHRLRESEERLRLAMRATDDVIHDWDFESERGSWTGAGVSLLGYPADTTVSPDWWLERVHPEDRERVRRAKQAFLAGSDAAWSSEYRLRRADGGYADVLDRCFLVRGPDGRPRRIVGSIMDVTERKHAREGLARQLARTHALFDLTATASRGAPLAEIHQRALDALVRGVGADRASILLFDKAGVMRFVAWHGLSDRYRGEVDGHSPWTPDASAPEPIVVEDVASDVSLGPLREVILGEGIRALAFIPIYHERLLGKFMLYFDTPRGLAADELEYALTVARHVAFATQRQQAEAELRSSQAGLRALAARLQEVREQERARIAREIHDELGQALTAFKMDIAAGQKLVEQATLGRSRREARERMRAQFEDMSRIVDGTVRSVRRIATELRPAILDDLGLVPALEWQAQEFQQRTGIRCAIASRLRGTRVRRDVATALFRVFQETLTNIARHAGARQVEVRLARENRGIVLEVHDDGRGISRSALRSTKGLGLIGMRERAATVGGEMDVERRRAGGTTVRVSVPLRGPKARGGRP